MRRCDGTPFTGADVLDVPLGRNEAGASEVRGNLAALLRQLWIDEEGFTGKRPFGDTGWQDEVHAALIRHGLVHGTLDEDGYVETLDRQAAQRCVLAAIKALAAPGRDRDASPPAARRRPESHGHDSTSRRREVA